MAWSTRELAELTGTTVNTIRHYHRLGLMEEPERRYNGYKQYSVPDLVRLLRIRRLAELGIPLSQITTVEAGGDATPEALRAVDAELTRRIEKLHRARASIAAILREQAPADVPPGFEPVAARLSEADSSILHIYRKLYDEVAMADLRRMVEADSEELGNELDALSTDADEPARRRLAEKLARSIAQNRRDYPWLTDPMPHLSRSLPATQRTFIEAIVELYTPAQRDVLERAEILATEWLQAERGVDEAE